jgi:hypothetical protein
MTDNLDLTMKFMERVFKLKAKMLKDKLTFVRTTCNIDGCEGEGKGEIVARLAGRKNHVHAYCTKCNYQMME